METFAIRDGLIHHVEVFPFVSLPFGLGDGWTPGSGHSFAGSLRGRQPPARGPRVFADTGAL